MLLSRNSERLRSAHRIIGWRPSPSFGPQRGSALCPNLAFPRASSSQIFEPALRPPSSRFSRRSRADPAAHFSSISCGKCSSPCCGNFRKISAEILREIRRNFQHEVFENFRKKKLFFKFPLEILRIFKVKMLKKFLRALRARYLHFSL